MKQIRGQRRRRRGRDGHGVGDWGVIFEWVPVLPTCQDGQEGRPVEGGRSGMGSGFWGGWAGGGTEGAGNKACKATNYLGSKQRLEGEDVGRAGGPNARSDRESGPRPWRGRASSVPWVTHFDARRTNQPAPPPARPLDLSTCAQLWWTPAVGLSVCPCQSSPARISSCYGGPSTCQSSGLK